MPVVCTFAYAYYKFTMHPTHIRVLVYVCIRLKQRRTCVWTKKAGTQKSITSHNKQCACIPTGCTRGGASTAANMCMFLQNMHVHARTYLCSVSVCPCTQHSMCHGFGRILCLLCFGRTFRRTPCNCSQSVPKIIRNRCVYAKMDGPVCYGA